MKGLLHRLAARAAGTAAPVRSDARAAVRRWRLRGEPAADGSSMPRRCRCPPTQRHARRRRPARAPPAATVVAPAPMAESRAAPGSVLAARCRAAGHRAPSLTRVGPPPRRAATSACRRGAWLTAPTRARASMRLHSATTPSPAEPAADRAAAAIVGAARCAASSVRRRPSRHARAEPARLMPAAAQRQPPAAPVAVAGHAARAAQPPPRAADGRGADRSPRAHRSHRRHRGARARRPAPPRPRRRRRRCRSTTTSPAQGAAHEHRARASPASPPCCATC